MTLREVGDAFAHAVSIAAEEAPEPWFMSDGLTLRNLRSCLNQMSRCKSARRAFYAGMTATDRHAAYPCATGKSR